MTVPTLRPLYSFAKVLGLHPLHVMGVDANIGTAQNRVCIAAIKQYSWQDSDGVSREELSWAIREAEIDLASELGYWPSPAWVADERIDLDQPPGAWLRSMYDIRGDRFSIKTQYGQGISGGRVAKSLIAAGQTIVYTDLDSDTYFETATIGPINLPTGVTDPEEIALYYPGSTQWSDVADDDWEVRPIKVTVVAGVPNTVTITCRREQLVIREALESLDPATAIDGLTDANFLDSVDVYRKYHDPSVQAQLVWRGTGGCCGAASDGCVTCGLDIQTGCLTSKDKKLGIYTVSPGTWDADLAEYTSSDVCMGRRPDYVRVWYRSGWRDMSLGTPNNTMSREWQLAVAKLAISKIDRLICSCKAVADVQSHWSADLRRSRSTRGESNTYRVTNYELENNPFGSTVAAMDVWRLVRRKGLGVPA